ncbi:MAG: hypothetical protein R3C01_06035 [Planctomycetaceae bacterium]
MLDADPQLALQHLSRVDPVLSRAIDQIGVYQLNPPKGTAFQALLKSIVYQQLSGRAAGTIHRRLLDLLPRSTNAQAQEICRLDDETLRGAGLSRSKMLSIRDLSQRQLEQKIPSRSQMHRLSDDEIIATLTEIRGVGPWTAQMILMFWLGRSDVLPLADLGIRRGYQILYQRSESNDLAELMELGETWKPYRSIAAWYLWRVADTANSPDAPTDW